MSNLTPKQLVQDIVAFYLPDSNVMYNFRPLWLKDSFGEQLSVDVFIPELKLCIDVDFEMITLVRKKEMGKDTKSIAIKKKDLTLTKIFKHKHINNLISKHLIKISKIKEKPEHIEKQIKETVLQFHNRKDRLILETPAKKRINIREAELIQLKETEDTRRRLRARQLTQSLVRS